MQGCVRLNALFLHRQATRSNFSHGRHLAQWIGVDPDEHAVQSHQSKLLSDLRPDSQKKQVLH